MLTINTVQKATVSIQPVDKKGHPASVEGIPVWTVSNEGPLSLFPADDGMKCDIVGLSVGTCQVNVTADADLGPGVKAITGTLDVQVSAAEAVGFAINVGTVEDQ